MAIDILGKARRLESTLAQSLDDAARRFANSGARQPLELITAIVEAVAAQLEPAGRGTFVFPFNKIDVAIVADGRDARTRFEAVLQRQPSLQHRIAERLRLAGCDPGDLRVDVSFVTRAESHWTNADFHIGFDRVARVVDDSDETTTVTDQIRVAIVAGSAQKPAYALTTHRINLGRCAEVRDGRHRLIRTNHIVFLDGAESNHTVSRQHAHIEHDAKSGHYRLCDDGSAHGTSIVRHGKTIAVPTGSRGVRLQPGDEIALGEARLRVRF